MTGAVRLAFLLPGAFATACSPSNPDLDTERNALRAADRACAKGVTVWRKETDRRWRCVADIWNDAAELPPIDPRSGS